MEICVLIRMSELAAGQTGCGNNIVSTMHNEFYDTMLQLTYFIQ